MIEWWGQAFRPNYELTTPYSHFAQVRSVNYGTLAEVVTTPAGTYPGGQAFFGGALLPDGRVFCVPYNSTTAMIYGNPLPSLLPLDRVINAYNNKL